MTRLIVARVERVGMWKCAGVMRLPTVLLASPVDTRKALGTPSPRTAWSVIQERTARHLARCRPLSAQTVHAAPEAPSVPVVQAESIPNREPGCCEQLLEYIGWRSEAGATKLNRISVNGNLDITVR